MILQLLEVKKQTELDATKKVIEQFGIENMEGTTGHSLGGNKAIAIANELGLNSETFNPLIGRDALSKKNPDVNHSIWGTVDDVASQLAELGDFDVNRVRPLESSLNPIKGHEMRNFTETAPRRGDFRDASLQDVHRAGKIHGFYR